MSSEFNLPVGTRIRFTRELTAPPCEDHPGFLYARRGDTGTITGHGTPEGYWAKTDGTYPPFGVAPGEFEVIETVPKAREKWNGKGKHCQSGLPHVCLAASFDGIVCREGECDIGSGNRHPRAKERVMENKPKREPKKNRTRKARWRGVLGGIWYLFEYDPAEGVIRVWKHRHHKKRIITMTDLLHALEGQRLLPL